MKTIHIILTAVILSALCGCRSHRNQTPVPETVTLQATMSTREVHTRHTDTVFIRIPAQESERETFDSVSVLESDYAVSEAQIRPDGSLRHTLRHKNTPLPVSVKVHDTAPSDHAKSYRSTVLPWLIATATTILLVLIAVKHLRTRF